MNILVKISRYKLSFYNVLFLFIHHYYSRDLIPLLIALQHNTWFTGVCGDGVRVGSEAWEALSRVVRCAAPPPQKLSWRAAALRHDHAARLGHAMSRARRLPAMHTIDFSQNHIEDKGLLRLTRAKCIGEARFRCWLPIVVNFRY